MFWTLLTTGLVFGAIFGFKAFGTMMMNRAFDSMPMPPATVATALVERQLWSRTLRSVGTLTAREGTVIAPEVEGTVAAIHFESGQRTTVGQLLIELDNQVERARVAAIEAQLELARLERTRYEDLARRQLSAGEEGDRRVSLGDYLKAGDPVVPLQSLRPIHLDFALPERVLAEVAVGMKVEAELDAYPGRRFVGVIAAIEPGIERDSRNFRLRAELDNAEGLLRPGGFARVRVEAGAPRAVLTVPQTAIRFEPYGNTVFAIEEGDGGGLVARQRFVETGAARGDLMAVERGLAAGERVAVGGLLKLRNGAPVLIDDSLRPDAAASPSPDNR